MDPSKETVLDQTPKLGK